MPNYTVKIQELGDMADVPVIEAPLREHRAVIRAIKRLYPDAEVELFRVVTDEKFGLLLKPLDPMPTWTR